MNFLKIEKIKLVLFLFIFFIRNIKTVMTTLENTTTAIVHEAINEEYEYIQYNKQLRLIRSVKDDMYQMQSIMNALRSTKQAYHLSLIHI